MITMLSIIRRSFLFFMLLLAGPFLIAAQLWQAQQDNPRVRIHAPGGGEALQGVVAIDGISAPEGFRSAELSFAYQNNPTNTWFLIQQSSMPVEDGLLASWDTTTIADGVYQIRLQVSLQDGQVFEDIVSGVRVRNYSVVETSTPGAASGLAVPSTATPTPPDYQAAPRQVTPLPPNPAQITTGDLQWSALQGVLVVVSALLIFGIYFGVRFLMKR